MHQRCSSYVAEELIEKECKTTRGPDRIVRKQRVWDDALRIYLPTTVVHLSVSGSVHIVYRGSTSIAQG